MERFRNILVAVDVTSGDFGRGTVPLEVRSAAYKACWMAEHSGASVTVMTVVGSPPDELIAEELRQLAADRLRESVLPLFGEIQVGLHVGLGSPAVEIIRQALRAKHDMVVVGARATTLMRRTIVGSVAMQLLRKCPCPVWVAPRRVEEGPLTVLSAVALHDLTPTVLELSARIVQLRGGSWHVFHCPEYPLEGGMRLRGVDVPEVEAYEREEREKAWTRLHELCDPLAAQTGITPKLWMSEGLPSEQIAIAAHQLDADVTVMGTIGRSGLAGMIIGNTADKVFSNARCSVLAIKPEGFQTPIQLAS